MTIETKRLTFEKVIKSQSELIFGKNYIDDLIEKNETIGKKSREAWFETVDYALLGLEANHDFMLEHKNGMYNLGNLAKWIRKLAYFDDTPDKKQDVYLKGRLERIENKVFWISLRENIFIPMAKALTLSLQISPETVTREGTAFEFDPRKAIKKPE